MLEVVNKNEVLVVDSRLVAEELGIQHKSFKETIRENIEDLENEYGKVALETATSNTSHQTETFYLLTEDQAIYLMTLSRNTDQVKKCKMKLVSSFRKARNALEQITNKLPSELVDLFKDMKQEIQVLATRTKRLDDIDNSMTKHKGCGNVIKAETDNEEYDLITAFEYLQSKGFGFEQANKLARRTATFERAGKGDNYEPPKNKKGHLLFEIKYLDQAFLSICNL